MGLLTELLLLPLAPARGVGWIAERVAEAAEREVYDPSVVLARLGALNEALERGEIGVEEFEREEDRLLDLLEQRQAGRQRSVRHRSEAYLATRHTAAGRPGMPRPHARPPAGATGGGAP